MILRSICLVATALLSFARADVQVTSPAPGDTITGLTLDIEWKDSGKTPKLADLTSYQVFLCAGGNTDADFIQLATLEQTGDFADGSTLKVPLTAGWGDKTANAYFLKFISAAAGGTVINYSDRFTLASMTGTFPASVVTGLKKVTGTAGPADVNNVAAGGQVAPGAAPAAGDDAYNTPYTLQSATIRYAPMPPMAQTKITAKSAAPLYPTSAYTVYKKIAGTPNAITTNTNPITFSTVSREPTIPANPMPSDANMQKYMNRWRD